MQTNTFNISKRASKEMGKGRVLYHIGKHLPYLHPKKNLDPFGRAAWHREWLKEPVEAGVFLTTSPETVCCIHGKKGNLYKYFVPEWVINESGGLHIHDVANEIIIPKHLWQYVKLVGKVDEKEFERKMKFKNSEFYRQFKSQSFNDALYSEKDVEPDFNYLKRKPKTIDEEQFKETLRERDRKKNHKKYLKHLSKRSFLEEEQQQDQIQAQQSMQDSYKKKEIIKRLPKEEIMFDSTTNKQIWITTTARIIARKALNIQHVRNVYLNMSIARTFASSTPKHKWRVNLKSLKPGEVGHIRYSTGHGYLRGGIWKFVAIEKAHMISIIWLRHM